MISLNAHIINKGVFNVNFDEEKKAFDSRKQLNNFFNQGIIPALELSFEQYIDTNTLVKIPKLEIDIGTIYIEHIDSDQLKQRIYQQVLKQINHLSTTEISSQSILKTQVKSYCYFLQFGCIENCSALLTINDFEQVLMADTSSLDNSDWLEIISALTGQQARQRFIYQHSDVFFHWFINHIQPDLTLALKQFQDLQHLVLNALQKKQLLLLCAIQADPQTSLSDLVLSIQENILEQGSVKDPTSNMFSLNNNPEESLSEKSNTDKQNLFQPEIQLSKDDEAETSEKAAVFFVSVAGIILLHPFFTDFFATLNLLNTDRLFNNHQSQIKAIFLLHTLSDNSETLEEHQALLFKVLCGLAVNEPIPQQLIIDDSERNESEQLLQAVIQHWQVLKNTSAEGLRDAFIQRDGKLQQQQDGWHLLVEQRSIDLLLAQLPWELSIIKLPWMKQALWVEWT